jgi:peptide/nickel transport system permease protein
VTRKTLTAILLRRSVQAVLVALLIGTISFFLMRSLPGDIAYRIASGRYGYDMTTTAAAEIVRGELHLDRPMGEALLLWWRGLLQLDFGTSVITGRPVMVEVWEHLAQTLRLAVTALILAAAIGLPLGTLAGLKQGGWVDRITLGATMVLRAIPTFVLGMMLVVLFSLRLKLLPVAGFDESGSIVLPALTLALGLGAIVSRIARDSIVRVTGSPYYEFARVKGLSDRVALVRHGLRNAAVPVIAYLGVQLAFLIEGVVVVEVLFSWPGIGHALIHALFGRDIPVIQGVVLTMSLIFVLLNTLVDIACAAIDPRLRPA